MNIPTVLHRQVRQIPRAHSYLFVYTQCFAGSSPNSLNRPRTIHTSRKLLHGNHHHHSHHHHSHDFNQLTKEGNRITIVGLVTNILLTGSKAVGGVICNSASLIADAAHSASDLISDGVTYWSFNMARKPKNGLFPYGYGRLDSLGSVAVSSILGIGAIYTGIYSMELLLHILSDTQWIPNSMHSHGHHHGITHHPLGISLAAISVLSKEILYHITKKIGKKAKSDVMVANAWHHRADSISSLVALIAISGSMLHSSLSILDPIGGIIVSGMIMKAGWDTGVSALRDLTDAAISKDVIECTQATFQKVQWKHPELRSLMAVRGRKMGHYLILDLKVRVDGSLLLNESEKLISYLKEEIMHDIHEIHEINVEISIANEHDEEAFKGK